jgi:phage terminase large subunit GpA-like protein
MIDYSLIQGFLDGLRPTARISVDQWADRYRMLSSVASSEPGPWRTDRTPYLREIMQKLSATDGTERVIVMKGAQLGLTEAGNNWVGYIVHVSPAPTLMVMPTEAMVKKNSKTRIDPMIEASPILRERIAPARSRDSGNTMLQKEFPGGVLMLVGANSATGLRSMPVRFLYLDEVDGYPMDLDGEGSPLALAMARTRTFAKRKIFMISTPTVEGMSIIEGEFALTDQRYFHVPCPHCGVYQDLVWDQMRWDKGKPDTVVYECRECSEAIEERFKPKMLAHGEWKSHAPENQNWKVVGYHINSLYSPYGWYSWANAVTDYEEAENDANKMKTFMNTVLGLTWKEVGDSPQWMDLWNKREEYEMNVPPEEVAFLTAGMDVQGDRLEVEIVGWGTGKRSWSIDYRVYDGDTAKPDVWKKAAELLNESWRTVDGRELRLSLMCVDSGFNTSHVYNFCINQDSSRVIPVKGQEKLTTMASAPRPVIISRAGTKVGSVKVWGVGVNMIKSELYGWLKINREEDGSKPAGYCTFPQYDQFHFKSLTAETVRITKDKKNFDKIEWVREFKRNERLDCRVYARAAAYVVGLDRFNDQDIELMRTQAHREEPKRNNSSRFWGGRGGFWDR